MRRLAMMLMIPAMALLVAMAFQPSSANEAVTFHPGEIGASAATAGDPDFVALLTLPFELVGGWISCLFPVV